MRIPLDYYRILGLPIQATAEQLQQAFRDRTMQLPRREYSEVAIAARRQLLDEAYSVLSDPIQRKKYDATFLAKTYDSPSADTTAAVAVADVASVDPNTPSIEIEDDQFVGALLLLQELGEYELVLNLGQPHLSNSFSLKSSRLRERKLVLPDIVLTVAIACLELGREHWQQGQYENAATSLSMGQEILLKEGVFPSVRGEIQADLYKLRPYRILELLALPVDETKERRKGIQLLKDVLKERTGIDGAGDDRSGLSIDDFLRFIQQLRSYLTAAEQQELFEEEARRPSAVATYLAVYALLARGFAERQPILIQRAKLMLMRLSRRQDVHLEQSVCALLLGQTEEASRALELSQEYEPLAFIREHSQGAPDLLPGLCLYGERWLQEEVFPHFRDLAEQQMSLKEYFADEQVQAYLEALPANAGSDSEWSAVTTESVAPSRVASASSPQSRLSQPSSATYSTASSRQMVGAGTVTGKAYGTAATLSQGSGGSQFGDAGHMPAAERVASGQNGSHRSIPSQPGGNGKRPLRDDGVPSSLSSSVLTRADTRSFKPLRLILLVVVGSLALAAIGILTARTIGWLRQSTIAENGAAPTNGNAPQVALDAPVLSGLETLDSPAEAPEAAEGPLTDAAAEQAIELWLTLKAKALGPEHDVESLAQILVDPALSRRQGQAEEAEVNGWHWEYDHRVEVLSVETSEDEPDRATVEASVRETAKSYENGEVNEAESYDDSLKVEYEFVRQDGEWRIRNMGVVR